MVLTKPEIIPYRIVSGITEPLLRSDHFWVCSEGNTVFVDTLSSGLPEVRLAGRNIAPKDLRQNQNGFEATFGILIDTWAGRTAVEIRTDVGWQSLYLSIQPHDRKVSIDEFEVMLTELSRHSPDLIWGLSPGEIKGASISRSLAVVHPAIIDSQLAVFERLLQRFLDDPPFVTIRTREIRPLNLGRRVDAKTVRWLVKRPLLVSAIKGNASAGAAIDPRSPVDQRVSAFSIDHPVTRYFAYLLRKLISRFDDSARTLRTASHTFFKDLETEAYAEYLAERMSRSSKAFRQTLRGRKLRDVAPEPLSETILQFLADEPLYAALHKAGRRMLEPGLAYDPSGDIHSALKHTYDLFELFVLHKLIEALPAAMGEGWKFRIAKTIKLVGREERPSNRSAWLFDGPDDLTLELRYQQWFSRAKLPPDDRPFTSLSGVNIPDFVLILRRDKTPVSWIILDAKFRSGQSAVDQGLGDLHRYRDALRVRGMKADGGFIVVPRLQNAAAPYAALSYYKHHAFGALQIFSEDWLNTLAGVLSRNINQNDSGFASVK